MPQRGSAAVDEAQPVAVGIVGVGRGRDRVLRHAGEPPGQVVAVHVNVGRAADRFGLLRNAPELVARELLREDRRAEVRRAVGRHFAEPVVRPRIGRVRERRSGEVPVLRAAGQRQRAGLRHEAVVIVDGRNRRSVDRNPDDAQVVVVAPGDAARDGPGPRGSSGQVPVVGVGERDAARGRDAGHVPLRCVIAVRKGAARDRQRVGSSRGIVSIGDGLAIRTIDESRLAIDIIGVQGLTGSADIRRTVARNEIDRRVREGVRRAPRRRDRRDVAVRIVGVLNRHAVGARVRRHASGQVVRERLRAPQRIGQRLQISVAVVRVGRGAGVDSGPRDDRGKTTPAVVGTVDRLEPGELRLNGPALRIDGLGAQSSHRRRIGPRPGCGTVDARVGVPVDRDRLGLRAQAQRIVWIRECRRPRGQRRQELSAGRLHARGLRDRREHAPARIGPESLRRCRSIGIGNGIDPVGAVDLYRRKSVRFGIRARARRCCRADRSDKT